MRRIVSENDVVIDIGANFGYYTTLMAGLVGPGGACIVLSPVPSAYKLLTKNVQMNRYPQVVHTNNAALGERPGKLTLRYPKRFGTVLSSSSDLHNDLLTECEAEMTTLDHYIQSRKIGKCPL